MQTLIVSDDEAIGSRVRMAVLGMGHECPPSNVVRSSRASDLLGSSKPELGVLAVGSELGDALTSLGQIRRLVVSPLLVVGSLSNPKAVLQLLRSGADDYLDQADIEIELPIVADNLISGRRGCSQPGRVIAVVSPSGGCGASTIAANLAVTLAKQHKNVGLIDLKAATGDLAALLDMRPIHSLADLFLSVDRVDRSLFERTLVRHDSGVHLLASPRRYDVRDVITADGVARILELARSVFPFVVLDVDPALGPEQIQALQGADVILVVMRLEFNPLCNARLAIDFISRQGVSRERMLVIANRHGQPKEIPIAKAEEALGQKLAQLIPDDPKTVIRANNNGNPVTLDAPSARCSKNLVQLATIVCDRLPKEA